MEADLGETNKLSPPPPTIGHQLLKESHRSDLTFCNKKLVVKLDKPWYTR